MGNEETARMLRDLAAQLYAGTGEQLLISHDAPINRALEATATGLQPAGEELAEGRRRWNAASRTWAALEQASSTTRQQLVPLWSGTDATACQESLRRLGASTRDPAHACGAIAAALGRLDDRLTQPRASVAASRAALAELRGVSGPEVTAQIHGQLSWMATQYDAAHEASASAARQICAVKGLVPSVTPATIAGPLMAALRAPTVPRRKVQGPRRSPVRVSRTIRRRPAAQRAAPVRRVAGNGSRQARDRRASVLTIMRRYQGIPYRWGGTTPRGFDCSGFVQYVYRQVGVRLPRTSGAQRRAGHVVPRSMARPGDLVCMPGHVGIYLGPGMMYDAPRTGKTIGARRIWSNNYVIVRVL